MVDLIVQRTNTVADTVLTKGYVVGRQRERCGPGDWVPRGRNGGGTRLPRRAHGTTRPPSAAETRPSLPPSGELEASTGAEIDGRGRQARPGPTATKPAPVPARAQQSRVLRHSRVSHPDAASAGQGILICRSIVGRYTYSIHRVHSKLKGQNSRTFKDLNCSFQVPKSRGLGQGPGVEPPPQKKLKYNVKFSPLYQKLLILLV